MALRTVPVTSSSVETASPEFTQPIHRVVSNVESLRLSPAFKGAAVRVSTLNTIERENFGLHAPRASSNTFTFTLGDMSAYELNAAARGYAAAIDIDNPYVAVRWSGSKYHALKRLQATGENILAMHVTNGRNKTQVIIANQRESEVFVVPQEKPARKVEAPRQLRRHRVVAWAVNALADKLDSNNLPIPRLDSSDLSGTTTFTMNHLDTLVVFSPGVRKALEQQPKLKNPEDIYRQIFYLINQASHLMKAFANTENSMWDILNEAGIKENKKMLRGVLQTMRDNPDLSFRNNVDFSAHLVSEFLMLTLGKDAQISQDATISITQARKPTTVSTSSRRG